MKRFLPFLFLLLPLVARSQVNLVEASTAQAQAGVAGAPYYMSPRDVAAYVSSIGGLPPQTGNAGKYLTTNGTAASWGSIPGALVPTAVKTGTYSAAVGDFVPADTTGGGFTITLPAAPADGSQIGVKMVAQTGTNLLTVAASGSDHFNTTAGSTSVLVDILRQSIVMQYKATGAIWYVLNGELPRSQLLAAPNSWTGVQTFTAPVLGTVAAGSILTNATGLPISSGVSGLAANVAAFLGAPSSANLGAALTDKTGTGLNVFQTSPSLITPTLGVALGTSWNGLGLNTTGITALAGPIQTPTFLDLVNNTADPAYTQGRVFYDQVDKTLAFFPEINGNKMNVGQETWYRVLNSTGSTIANGVPVYASGGDGTNLQISPASASAENTSKVLGLTTGAITTGSIGYVTQVGVVHGMNTSAFSAGVPLFLGTSAGTITATAPSGSNYIVQLGNARVINASTGEFVVTPMGGRIATSGGTGTVTVLSSGALASGAIMTGGGTTVSQTPSATSTLDGSGNMSLAGTLQVGNAATNAGGFVATNGTANTAVANSYLFQAPTSITTGFTETVENAVGSSGFYFGTVSSQNITRSKVAANGTGNVLLSAGTAAIASGKTLTMSNTLTFTGTDGSSVAFGAGGTVAFVGLANSWASGIKQTFSPSATISGFNVGSVSGDVSTPANGDLWYDSTGNLLRARINGATVSLGAGGGGAVSISGTPSAGQSAEWTNATTIQGVAVTGSGNYVKATSPTFVTPILGAAAATTINGNTFTTGTYTLTGTAGKTFNFTNSLTFSGTDSTTMTMPAASTTLAGLGTTQTFTGINTLTPSARSSGVASFFNLNAPADTGQTASTESIGINIAGSTRTWATGALTTQRGTVFGANTIAFAAASTVTNLIGVDFLDPIAGANATATNIFGLRANKVQFTGIMDSSSATSKIGALQTSDGKALSYVVSSYAAGTGYTLTNTSAAVTFSGTSPVVVLDSAGTYRIHGRVNLKYVGATFAAPQNVTIKLRRTNNTAADVANAVSVTTTGIVTTLTNTFMQVDLPDVSYTTAATTDSITEFADVATAPSAGTLQIVEANIYAQRLF